MQTINKPEATDNSHEARPSLGKAGKRQKYEVVPYNSGNGFFIHGGTLRETYIQDEDDAKTICDALNTVEKWKKRATLRTVQAALFELELLKSELE